MSIVRSPVIAVGLLATTALLTSALTARAEPGVPGDLLSPLEWQCIGPSRGGRASSVAGVIGDPLTYYMGACGGGVWKTSDAGSSWRPITDGFLGTGSVGSIAVAPSDPNVIYIGMGEPDIRGNFSHGDGVYRSVDSGRTWTHLGLDDTRQIGRIVVDPRDPDVALVAALGHVFGPNAERGVFRTTDGGATWTKVLYVDDRTGAVDLSIDPTNPRIVFAGLWPVARTPWGLASGADTGGVHRSTDGGVTWTKLGGGLPDGLVGKVGVSASAAKPGRVWALVEAEDGGLFRSDDSGDSWSRVNEDRELRQRAWYYTRVYADPVEPDTVYVMNVRFHKSRDAGATFRLIRVPHSDNHDLWIDPHDNRRMVNANDGGANVTFDGGQTWSRQDNQPTAQFYRVAVDTRFPYRVLGAQQDNSTVSITSRNRLGRRWGREDFHAVGGGESGYVTPRPDDPNIVYAGSYGGYLTRYDHRTQLSRNIMVWPENPMGGGADVLEQRFQWTFPIVLSPHDPDVLYTASQMLYRSEDGGETWTPISPDLTTDDKTKQRSSGGPITKDNTGVEYYCTIFTVVESPLRPGMIWAGTDDGLAHVTTDGGDTWTDVTPPDLGDWPLISMIEASPHDADTAYLAVTRYKMDDFRPYVYRTTDAGTTWDLVVDGIDDDAFVRSVRVDPVRRGLLYAATETGVWMSVDHGAHWQSLQLELPVVPVTDLVVKDDDLVISTQGRSFWILEGLSMLRQLDADVVAADTHLFAPATVTRARGASATLRYRLADRPDDAAVVIAILDSDGETLRTFASDATDDDPKPATGDGMHTFTWDLRLAAPREVPGAVGWPGNPSGPRVPPGTYTVRLTVGDIALDAPLEIQPDPRVETTAAEYAAVFAFERSLRDTVDTTHEAVNTIRTARAQADAAVTRAEGSDGADAITDAAKTLTSALTEIEEALIQTKTKSSQDALNFPVRLNDKLSGLMMYVNDDHAPTPGARRVFAKLETALHEQLDRLHAIVDENVVAFNTLVAENAVPAVAIALPGRTAPDALVRIGTAAPVHGWDDVSNVFRDGRTWFAGQPRESAWPRFAESGIEVVVNLRTTQEMQRLDFDQVELVESLGMTHVHMPVTPDSLSIDEVERLAAILDDTEGGVLIHCGSSNRAGALWAAYLVRERGVDVEAAIEHGKSAGLRRDSAIEAARRVATMGK